MLDRRAKRIATELGDALRAFGFTIDELGGDLSTTQDALVDLLIEHVPVARGALPESVLDPLMELDLVRVLDGTTLVAPRDVRPYSDGANNFFVVSDATEPDRTGAEHVLGVGHASLTLASLVPRLSVERALDVGTGSGIQALHLATHAQHVVATDVSAEALECAALSAALSGVELDLRPGSMYEPIGSERFDLIVSNPPFVISPRKAFTYRDAGREGDDFVRELVSTAHHRLRDGGWFVTLANWLHPKGRDWRERVVEWVAPTGCDAWVVQRDLLTPADYVRTWLADAGTPEDSQWLDWFTEHDIEAIGFGWIVLHAAGRDYPHRRFEVISHPVEHPMGPWLLDRFALEDVAADLDDEQLLFTPMRVSEIQIADGVLQVERGWRRQVRVDDLVETFLARVQPDQQVGAALGALAAEHGFDLETAADLVRELLRYGALRPSAMG